MTADEVPLPAGRMTEGILRRGGQVLRPMGSWSPAVHEYLRHLESAGFAGAPRLLGLEGDREVLTYIEGEVAADPDWQPGRGARLPGHARTDEALAGVARLIRRLHRAAEGFVPQAVGYRFRPHPPGPGQLVSHGDLGPWNTVYRDGVPVAFIDWDAVAPVEPLVELAAAAWAFVPLAPPERLRESGFTALPDLPGRLRIFLDAYGLTDRRAILPALQWCRLEEAARVAHAPVGPAAAAESLDHLADELRWLQKARADLERAL
jgi:Phosphotransferase enzyme family